MPLTHEYNRFSADGKSFALIASDRSNVKFVKLNSICDKFVATSCGQHIAIWDCKTRQLLYTLDEAKTEITVFDVNYTNEPLIATGHADGSVDVYNYIEKELKVKFDGHKTRVSCIAFDDKRMRLASGALDNVIILWDLVNEVGLFKLKGHTHGVTQIVFMNNYDVLISCSKDKTVKFWDLERQHCFKTFVAHRAPVLDIALFSNDSRLITGANEIKVWKILPKESLENQNQIGDEREAFEEDFEDESNLFKVLSYGSILRQSQSNFRCFSVDSRQLLITIVGRDPHVECFKINTDEEIDASIKKRTKKLRKQAKRKADGEKMEEEIDLSALKAERSLTDEIERQESLTFSARVKFVDVFVQRDFCKLIALLTTNSIEMQSYNLTTKEIMRMNILSNEGHRTSAKTLTFSSDSYYIASASMESVKVWNRANHRCTTTIASGVEQPTAILFSPNDQYILTTTKSGKIQIFDIASSTLIGSVDASEKAVWSITSLPKDIGIAVGCEDMMVQLWHYESQYDEENGGRKKRLSLKADRTLTCDEGVLCVKTSPNGKFIAASLLDCKVKIFYLDTFKFFLSLYSHKLPVLTMDISFDSHLIITGSSDKNIKIWGLDFGDCHRSIFAHDASIVGVRFIPKTHYFFSCSSDKTVKLWDGDKFQKICTFNQHQNEVVAIDVSPCGHFLVSASSDKTMRIFEETEEPLILEEEQELEREDAFDKMFDNDQTFNPIVPGENNEEIGFVVKSTKDSTLACDRLIEAIDIFKGELTKIAQNDGDTANRNDVHIMLTAYGTTDPYVYMLRILCQIKLAHLEEAILSLSFGYVADLLIILADFLEKGLEVEYVARYICFIARLNFGQIVATPKLVPTMDKIKRLLPIRVKELKDLFNFNLSGLSFYLSELEVKAEVQVFLDAFDRRDKRNKKRKSRGLLDAVPIISMR